MFKALLHDISLSPPLLQRLASDKKKFIQKCRLQKNYFSGRIMWDHPLEAFSSSSFHVFMSA
jgi:hypothetical protein